MVRARKESCSHLWEARQQILVAEQTKHVVKSDDVSAEQTADVTVATGRADADRREAARSMLLSCGWLCSNCAEVGLLCG